jgi:hypothetical protein
VAAGKNSAAYSAKHQNESSKEFREIFSHGRISSF